MSHSKVKERRAALPLGAFVFRALVRARSASGVSSGDHGKARLRCGHAARHSGTRRPDGNLRWSDAARLPVSGASHFFARLKKPGIETLERAKGIEPSYAAWEAAVLPLNYARRRRDHNRTIGPAARSRCRVRPIKMLDIPELFPRFGPGGAAERTRRSRRLCRDESAPAAPCPGASHSIC